MREPVTVTAVMSALRGAHRQHALDHFMHRLKRWARAYALTPDTEMPDHKIEWMTELGDGPVRVIDEAMREFPALWLSALPDDVCIVPKRQLARLVGGPAAEYLSGIGVNIVESYAAQMAHDRRERQ